MENSILNGETTVGYTIFQIDNKIDTGNIVFQESFKIDNDFIGSPSFHVHWTKGDDTNQSGNTVRWQIDYHVFNGRDQDISNGSITTLIVDDTYDDAGSTTRVVHRTQNIDASNFTAGYYVGLAIKVVPGSTTVVNPTLITVDLITDIAIE